MIPEQIQHATLQALNAGVTSIVVSGVFSPVNHAQEEATAAIIKQQSSGTLTTHA